MSILKINSQYGVELKVGMIVSTTTSDFDYDMVEGCFTNTEYIGKAKVSHIGEDMTNFHPGKSGNGGCYGFDYYVIDEVISTVKQEKILEESEKFLEVFEKYPTLHKEFGERPQMNGVYHITPNSIFNSFELRCYGYSDNIIYVTAPMVIGAKKGDFWYPNANYSADTVEEIVCIEAKDTYKRFMLYRYNNKYNIKEDCILFTVVIDSLKELMNETFSISFNTNPNAEIKVGDIVEEQYPEDEESWFEHANTPGGKIIKLKCKIANLNGRFRFAIEEVPQFYPWYFLWEEIKFPALEEELEELGEIF